MPVSLRWEYILQGLLQPSGITMDHGIGKAKGSHDFDFDCMVIFIGRIQASCVQLMTFNCYSMIT